MKSLWIGGVAIALSVAVLGVEARQRNAAPSAASGPACRTYAASYRIETTSDPPTFTSTIVGTCETDPAARKTTCINRYTDSMGGSNTSTSVTSYLTVGDIVAEVGVVPPMRRSVGTATSVTGGTGTTLVNSYDSQNRLAGETAAGSTVTYTAWDRSGRPTAATQTAGGTTVTLTYAYDNAARTLVTESRSVAGASTCTSVFDAEGNNTSNVCTTPGGTTTAKTTISATKKVCR
jgi:YD repeat-containing protein